jgi:hypothetical protein
LKEMAAEMNASPHPEPGLHIEDLRKSLDTVSRGPKPGSDGGDGGGRQEGGTGSEGSLDLLHLGPSLPLISPLCPLRHSDGTLYIKSTQGLSELFLWLRHQEGVRISVAFAIPSLFHYVFAE